MSCAHQIVPRTVAEPCLPSERKLPLPLPQRPLPFFFEAVAIRWFVLPQTGGFWSFSTVTGLPPFGCSTLKIPE